MKTLRKAVIPVAGLGTRFLPATKSIPKELFPIVDKPILLYTIEECLAAGLDEIIFIQGRGKTAIEDFFDTSFELETLLAKTGKTDLLKTLENIRNNVKVISVRQKQALGLGHAVLMAAPIVGDEPFAVLLGDEIMIHAPEQTSGIGQLAEAYRSSRISTVAVMEVPAEDVEKYGIIAGRPRGASSWTVDNVVEKPRQAQAPSRLALPGRYVFSPQIFKYLAEVKPGRNGEIQLTDAMTALAQNEGLNAMTLQTRRFDAGDKLGFLQANVEMALEHPEIGAAFRSYLKQRASTL